MRCSVSYLGAIALALVLSQGCAPQPDVVKFYEDSAFPAKAYTRLLVVDVSSDPERQQVFEDEIVTELRDAQVAGVSAHPTLTFQDDVQRAEITRYGKEVGADGILLTSFVSVDASAKVNKGRTDIQSSCRGGNVVDYFLYDHDVIREPDSISAEYDVIVVSSLYDVATGERVWSIQSTCSGKTSVSDALRDEARVIVQQLREDERI